MLLDILFFIETYTVFDHSSPKERFKAKATLLSKTFSYFPHGTCLLSVSNTYLAADGIYHQFCAPVPRNVTPGTKHRAQRHAHDTQDLNPPGCFFSKKLSHAPLLVTHVQKTIQGKRPQFPCCVCPCSFAITHEIPCGF